MSNFQNDRSSPNYSANEKLKKSEFLIFEI